MDTLAAIFKSLFGCIHPWLSRVFTIQRRTYRVCCDCGAEFDYSLEPMSMKRTRTNQYLERGIRNSSVLVMRADARRGIVQEDADYVPSLPTRQ
jgi:hypothetical protein